MNAVALRRQLGYRLGQMGVSGNLGLAMLLLAALVWFALVYTGEKDILAAQHRLQVLQQQVANKSNPPVNPTLDREQQLQEFYQGFAKAEQLPEALKRIYQAAQKQDLLLETGEYTRLQTGTERLARFRVALPAKGSFKQLLGFMNAVLQENNTVALENAAFKRDKVDEEAIEAKLVFLLYIDTKP